MSSIFLESCSTITLVNILYRLFIFWCQYIWSLCLDLVRLHALVYSALCLKGWALMHALFLSAFQKFQTFPYIIYCMTLYSLTFHYSFIMWEVRARACASPYFIQTMLSFVAVSSLKEDDIQVSQIQLFKHTRLELQTNLEIVFFSTNNSLKKCLPTLVIQFT